MTDQIFATAISTVKETDLNRMLSFDLSDEDVRSISKTVEFSGYDPVVTFNIIMRVIGRDEEKKKQLITLIIFGLTRGFGANKSMQDILNRTNVEGRENLQNSFATFRVCFVRPTDKKQITISRILTAFPILVYKMHEKLMNLGKIKPIGYTGMLPSVFQYPGSPAMMSQNVWDVQKENYLEYVNYLSDLWNQEFDYDDAEKYAILSFQSRLVPLQHRVEIPDLDEEAIGE